MPAINDAVSVASLEESAKVVSESLRLLERGVSTGEKRSGRRSVVSSWRATLWPRGGGFNTPRFKASKIDLLKPPRLQKCEIVENFEA